jgi:hypothetical protein
MLIKNCVLNRDSYKTFMYMAAVLFNYTREKHLKGLGNKVD